MSQRNQMRAVKRNLESLTPRLIADVVRGVQQDILSGQYSDAAMVTPVHTVAQLKAIPNWIMDHDVLDHMIGSVLGRMTHVFCIEEGIHPLEMTIEQALALANMTNDVQQRTLRMMTMS